MMMEIVNPIWVNLVNRISWSQKITIPELMFVGKVTLFAHHHPRFLQPGHPKTHESDFIGWLTPSYFNIALGVKTSTE